MKKFHEIDFTPLERLMSEHGLNLLQGEIEEIFDIVNEIQFNDRPTPPIELKTAEEILEQVSGEFVYYNIEQIIPAMEAYHAQYKENNWIDVNDRLPEYGEDVLVASIESDIVKIGFYNQSDWYVYESNTFEVTHYMLLPQPPITKQS
jgi:hypothetical protein